MKAKKGFSLAECMVAMAIIVMFSGLATTVCMLGVKTQQTALCKVESRNFAEKMSICFAETYKKCGKSNEENDKIEFINTFNDYISAIVGTEDLNAVTDMSNVDGNFVGGKIKVRDNDFFFGESKNDSYRTFSFLYKYTTADYVVKWQMNIRTGTYTATISTASINGTNNWYSSHESY